MEDGAGQEELFEFIEGSLISRSPVPVIVFLGEVEERAGDDGVVGDELMVKVGTAKERLYVLDFGHGWPGGDAIEFDWVHGELTGFHNHSKVFNFWDI